MKKDVYPLTLYSRHLTRLFYTAYSGREYFIVAKLLDCYCVEPFIIDENFGSSQRIFPDDRDNRFTWSVSTIPEENKRIFSYYSDEITGQCDDTVKEDSVPSDIALLDMVTKQIQTIYTTDQYVCSVAGNGKNISLLCT